MGGLSSGVTGRIMTETMMKPTGAEVRLLPVLSVPADKVAHFADCMAEAEALNNWIETRRDTATADDLASCLQKKTAEGRNAIGMTAELLRAAFVSPAAVDGDDVLQVQGALSLCREIVSHRMKKKGLSMVDLAHWRECRTMLSHLQALTFPDSPEGVGARSVWLRNKADVQALPAVVRCYLYPNDFRTADKAEIKERCDSVHQLAAAMWDSLEKGRKPSTVGFSAEEVGVAIVISNGLLCSLSRPCEELAAKGLKYQTRGAAA